MLRSILIGIVAGSRSITPLAVVTNAARRGQLPEADAPVRFLAHPAVVAGATALAAAELAGDKMKTAPDRIVPIGMVARLGSAAIAGAALAPKRDRPAAALAAVATAFIASHLSFRARIRAMARYGQTSTGFIEDAVVLGSGIAIGRSGR